LREIVSTVEGPDILQNLSTTRRHFLTK